MSIKVYSSDMQADQDNTVSCLFVNDMENIYQTHSIYRGIVVTDINKENEYKELLEYHTHTVSVIDTVDDVDYEAIDSRVLLMDYHIFRVFANRVLRNAVKGTSYNFIGITYDIANEIKEELIDEYHKLARNNTEIIII